MRSNKCPIEIQEKAEEKESTCHKEAKTPQKQNKSLQPARTLKPSTRNAGSRHQAHPHGFSAPRDREQASEEKQTRPEKEKGIISDISTATLPAR